MTAASNEVVAALQETADDLRRIGWHKDRGNVLRAISALNCAHSDPRPVAEGLREAIIAAITEADGRFGYSYRLTKMDETGEEHTLFMDGFEPAVFEDRADGYPVIEQRRNTLRTDAILAALANHSLVPMAGEGWIVGNNTGQWRTFDTFGWAWTDRRDLAVRYARREDAELVHGDDEDSWRVEQYPAAAHPSTQEGGREQRG